MFKHVFNLGGQEVDAASGGTAPMDRASGTLQWLAYTPPIPLPSPKLSVDFAKVTSLARKHHGLPPSSLPHCPPRALICHGVPQSHVALCCVTLSVDVATLARKHHGLRPP